MGKKLKNRNGNNSNVITNSKVEKSNIYQIQNAEKKADSNTPTPTFHELLISIHELTQEVKELKEQIKNNNS